LNDGTGSEKQTERRMGVAVDRSVKKEELSMHFTTQPLQTISGQEI
jgi:hypothetical protein